MDKNSWICFEKYTLVTFQNFSFGWLVLKLPWKIEKYRDLWSPTVREWNIFKSSRIVHCIRHPPYYWKRYANHIIVVELYGLTVINVRLFRKRPPIKYDQMRGSIQELGHTSSTWSCRFNPRITEQSVKERMKVCAWVRVWPTEMFFTVIFPVERFILLTPTHTRSTHNRCNHMLDTVADKIIWFMFLYPFIFDL